MVKRSEAELSLEKQDEEPGLREIERRSRNGGRRNKNETKVREGIAVVCWRRLVPTRKSLLLSFQELASHLLNTDIIKN